MPSAILVQPGRVRYSGRVRDPLLNLRFLACCAVCLAFREAPAALPPPPAYLSPTALAATPEGKWLFVACATARQIVVFDVASGTLAKPIPLPDAPSGLVLSQDGARLYVTCSAPQSHVSVLDAASGKVLATVPAGHTAMAPVLSPDGKTLFVCNRFNNDVSVIDLQTGKEQSRIPVQREPVAADITPRWAISARRKPSAYWPRRRGARRGGRQRHRHRLAQGRSRNSPCPTAAGCSMICASRPDGKYAVVTHLLPRFRLPATQLDRGWMNNNAATIIDLARMEVLNTVLLDNIDRGAANPWGVAWSADSATLLITHAGTHEVSVIDFPATLAKLAKVPAALDASKPADPYSASAYRPTCRMTWPSSSACASASSCLRMISARAPWSSWAAGPTWPTTSPTRSACSTSAVPGPVPIHPALPSRLADAGRHASPLDRMTPARKGEFYFHDAGICFQGWQSCASCHPGQARVDGLNWDLLNDGIGNPKNTKSLLLAHKTPPAMSMGVRETAETAVRAGIQPHPVHRATGGGRRGH